MPLRIESQARQTSDQITPSPAQPSSAQLSPTPAELRRAEPSLMPRDPHVNCKTSSVNDDGLILILKLLQSHAGAGRQVLLLPGHEVADAQQSRPFPCSQGNKAMS